MGSFEGKRSNVPKGKTVCENPKCRDPNSFKLMILFCENAIFAVRSICFPAMQTFTMHLFKQRGGHYPWASSGRAKHLSKEKGKGEKEAWHHPKKALLPNKERDICTQAKKTDSWRKKDTQTHIQLPKKKSQIHDRRHRNRKGSPHKKKRNVKVFRVSRAPHPLSSPI